MKKVIFIAILTLMIFNVSAQRKMYIWKPKVEEYAKSNVLKDVQINVKIVDLRVIAPGSEIEATFEQISDAIIQSLKKTYGNAFINEKSEKTVTVELMDYSSSFYTGMWVAQTKYVVKYGDVKEEIEQSNQSFNTLGKSNGKKVLNKSFTGTNMKLFGLLNNIFRTDK